MHTRFIHAVFVGTILLLMAAAAFAQVSVGVVITIAPPPLPIYDQPLCPGENYIWTPGYWAYGDDFDDYYWVPGTWVLAPEVGFLWTPGYWEWNEDRYVFYDGYWGPQVGFYGGIFYGFGYFGEGYEGGRWDHDRFFYNTTVNNVNITEIHNVYNAPVSTIDTRGGKVAVTSAAGTFTGKQVIVAMSPAIAGRISYPGGLTVSRNRLRGHTKTWSH